jgi:hypothetical protein
MKLNKATKLKIVSLIKEREDFKNSLNTEEYDEFLHCYNAFSFDETDKHLIKIMAEYDDGVTYDRQFLIFEIKTNTLREATEEEDETFREYDDETYIREQEDTTFLISRDEKNKVINFNNEV